ncbi:MAG: GGDEF domain-containing protein, partial [Gemmatimonadota bacterium]
SVMIIDVDRFKFFNDTYRHVEGDRALRFIAEKLSGAFRKSDIVARVGGDEFGVLLADTGHREAVQLADRARKIVRSASFHPGETGRSVALTISIGVATYPTPNRELAALYDEADRALMHGSKKAGGDSVYGYGEDGTIG